MRGVLFFPVTPFAASGEIDHAALAEHVRRGVAAGPGGVFVACGTGEFHALELTEYAAAVRTAVDAVGGRVPVFAGTGGSIAQARQFCLVAADGGADGVLLLPPYLVGVPQQGLVDYVTAVSRTTDLDVIVYHRANARFTEASAAAVARLPHVVGLKDGVGDLELMSRLVGAIRSATDKPFEFFNGMPTAEASQLAYRAIGVPLYSSAVFAFAPDLSLAFHAALERNDDATITLLLQRFFHPLVRIRDRVPGYAVSLVKAAVSLAGPAVGGVRPPLIDPSDEDLGELAAIIADARAAIA